MGRVVVDIAPLERPILHACLLLVDLKTYCQCVLPSIRAVYVLIAACLVAILPYMIFSLFHALTFTRTTLMSQFLPPGPPATAGGPPQPHPLAKKLQAWVKGNLQTT